MPKYVCCPILCLFILKISQGQYVDGLRAPVVLYRPHEVYEYNEEFTVVVGDWYHEEHPILLKRFINTDNPDGVEPVPGAYRSSPRL